MTVFGMPAPNAACLAGAWPKFALRTFPKKTSWTSCGSMLALFRAPAVLEGHLRVIVCDTWSSRDISKEKYGNW